MTGYGRATGLFEGEGLLIEVSAVNHRFLEPTFRLPYVWNAVEPVLRDTLKQHVSRGKVNINIRRERGAAGHPNFRFDPHVAETYIEASRELAALMSSTDALSLDALMTLDGVFYQEDQEQDLDAVKAALTVLLGEALVQFNTAREREGEALAADLRNQLAAMRDALASIEAQIPAVAQAYEERLQARLAELNTEVGIKEDRLAMELALMAEKTDVNEEVVRLKAHFTHVTALLDSPDPIGRELNFLAQEIQRETNTLGSKLRDIGATKDVLRIKGELEKLREQAQNIE